MSERLMVMAPLDNLSPGQEFHSLPAHITLVPWFDIEPEYWNEFDTSLRERVREDLYMATQGVSRERFDHDASVTRMGGVMFGAHAAVLSLAKAFGRNMDERYTGLHWSPHVTDKNNRVVEVGESVVPAGIAVIEKKTASKRVKSTYTWSI